MSQDTKKKYQSQTSSPQRKDVQPAPRPIRNLAPAHMTAERHLIARMLQEEELAYRIMDMLGDIPFHFDEHQAILTYLLGYL